MLPVMFLKMRSSGGRISLGNASVLILSASRKTLLSKWVLKAAKKYNLGVLGSDLNPDAPALSLLDKSISLPDLKDPSFINELLLQIKANNIKLIIPTRDEELLFFPNYIEILKSSGCFVLCNPLNVTKKMIDKRAFTRFCIEELEFSNLRVINTPREAKAEDFPLFFRGLKSGTSLKIKIYSQAELNAVFLLFPNGVATTYLEGIEISVDCYVSREGRIIYIVPRTRDITLGTESIVTTTIDSSICREVAQKLILKSGIKGPAVLQGKLHRNNFTPFEINLRFGGASVLSFKAAYSAPELALKEFVMGKKLIKTYQYEKRLKLFKDYKEVYIAQ